MIFATVGSTYFDKLIMEVDRLASEGVFKEEVVCQIGSGSYVPRSCRYFAFSGTIEEYLNNCNLIITHGGMTVLEGMWRNKPIVAVANTDITGNHQVNFLRKLSEISDLVWTDNPKGLRLLIPAANVGAVHFREPHISEYIRRLVKDK